MRLIDPLKTKVHELVRRGDSHPLENARARFGSPNDYRAIAADLASADRSVDAVLVDLTPFERVGTVETIDALLLDPVKARCVTLLATEGGVVETLLQCGLAAYAAVAVYDRMGQLATWYVPQPARAQNAYLHDFLVTNRSLEAVHRFFAAQQLLEMLPGSMEYAHKAPKRLREVVSGRDYLRLSNGMLVSCYLNTKKLFNSSAQLFEVAFAVSREIYSSFRRDVHQTCDILVAPTNNSLVLASAVHAITAIPLCVIDKIGPIPARHLSAFSTSVDVKGRRVCLVVEVSSTGSEIDRSLQYLDYRKASVARVISCYHWGVAKAALCDRRVLTVLCEPRREFGYVYRSS